MDLFPPALRARITSQFPLGSQEGRGDAARVLVKFFFPAGRYTLLVTEGGPTFADPGSGDDEDFLFFGFVQSPFDASCDEWGYTTLSDLQSVNLHGLRIERDLAVPFATRSVADCLGATSAA